MHSSGAGERATPSRRLPLDQLPAAINGYRVDGVLGQGGTGIVLRVYDEALDRPMALKLLADELDDDARARFMIEARAAGRIIHPNVVQVYAVGSFEGRIFITQELVEGHALSSLLEARGQLSARAVIDIGVQVARGLSRAAEVGVVHRDVKPHNLLVTDDGTVKLADFGLAKLLHAPSPLTDSGTTVGTPHYMSPEQGLAQELDPRSDQYSLGATLYHLVAGRAPFDAENAVALLLKHVQEPLVPLAKVAPDCPPLLAAAIERMLEKKKESRFDQFEDVIAALEDAADALFEDAEPANEAADLSMPTMPPSEGGETNETNETNETIETIEEDMPPALSSALSRTHAFGTPASTASQTPYTTLPTVPVASDALPARASRVRETAVLLSLVGIALAVVIVAGFRRETRRAHAVPAPVLSSSIPAIVERREAITAEVKAPVESRIEKSPIEKLPPLLPVKETPNKEARGSRFDRLLAMLDDAKTSERAAKELGELGDQRATPALIRLLEGSGSPKSRAAAADALGRLGDTRAIAPLQEAAEHAKVDAVREAARSAHQRLFHVVEE